MRGGTAHPREAFYPETGVVEGNCPVHGTKLGWQKENVFFRLSRCEKPLLDLYGKQSGGRPFVFPETRLNKVHFFVAASLGDVSVLRSTIS